MNNKAVNEFGFSRIFNNYSSSPNGLLFGPHGLLT